jgi:hypothetical protein
MTISRLLAKLRKHAHGLMNIHENEMHSIREAMSNYLEVCEQRIANGATEPFIADRSTIKGVPGLLGDAIERALTDAPTWDEPTQKNTDQ